MSKKTETNQIISTAFEDLIGERFGRYSKYIIQERALPDARDGLKPVQRRILYAMYHDGNTAEKAYRKSAKTVGLVIGNYHPHGDSSVYDAMVRMSQSWKSNQILVDMHGNNGSIDDDPAAAMRYTEARLSKIASELLSDLDKETVTFAPNFDDTEVEPVVLPAAYPNLLVNGATGIAAGYATNIPPHNMAEVIDATIYRLTHPNCTLEELQELVKGPDFPTGGIVQGKEGIHSAFSTGKGRIVIRSKAEIIEKRSSKQIVITELPYDVIKSNVVKKIDDLRFNKEVEGISEVRDESDRTGLKILIDLKKDSDAQLILNYLYKNTDLQVYYNYNIVAIVDQRPIQLGLAQLIDAYLVHREEVVLRRSTYLLNKLSSRSHILEGLMKATSIMDEIIALIRSSKNKEDAKKRLMASFEFSDLQAEAIVNLRLYRLTSTDIVLLKEEYANILMEIRDLRAIVEDRNILNSTIVEELKMLKENFATARKTQIESEIEEIVIEKTQMISNERVMCTVSQAGYLNNVSMRSYLASIPALPYTRDDDELLGYQEVDSHDIIFSISSNGEYSLVPLYLVAEGRWKEIGTHINNYVKYDEFSSLVTSNVIKKFDTDILVVTVSKFGMIKSTPLNQFELIRTSSASTGMRLKAGDEIVAAYLAQADDDILLASKQGFVLRYPLSVINPTSPKAMGVIAMNLSKDDEIAASCNLALNSSEIVIISDKGTLKRFKASDFEVANRATKGERVFKQVKSNPVYLKHLVSGNLEDQINLITADKLLEIAFKEIALMGKDATFSNPLDLKAKWYLVKGLSYIK